MEAEAFSLDKSVRWQVSAPLSCRFEVVGELAAPLDRRHAA